MACGQCDIRVSHSFKRPEISILREAGELSKAPKVAEAEG